MHIVAGTFNNRAQASHVLGDLQKIGISPENMGLIEGEDRKGFEREHRGTRTAALRGALVGAILGAFVFGALLLLSLSGFTQLRTLALFAGGIAMTAGFGALIAAMWNIGNSHDEALLYEEARIGNNVIAAVEVSDPMEQTVIHALEDHGARNVRSGLWQPAGWKHAYPGFDNPV